MILSLLLLCCFECVCIVWVTRCRTVWSLCLSMEWHSFLRVDSYLQVHIVVKSFVSSVSVAWPSSFPSKTAFVMIGWLQTTENLQVTIHSCNIYWHLNFLTFWACSKRVFSMEETTVKFLQSDDGLIISFVLLQNGIYSALPFLGLWAIMNISPMIADKLRSSGTMSTIHVRKLFNTIGNLFCTTNGLQKFSSLWLEENCPLP